MTHAETHTSRTFWEHLDELRSSIIKIIATTVVAMVVVFCFKKPLFDIVLAPTKADFVTYRLLAKMLDSSPFATLTLVNLDVARQLFVHLRMAFIGGALCAMPYTLYEAFHYLAPALYRKEKRYVGVALTAGYAMFIIGVLLSYFVVFPLTLNFLASYQVDSSVPNYPSLESYVSMLTMLCLIMGIVFEMPVLSWIMSKLGVLKREWMVRYRRHAIVVIAILAAIITPTADAVTLLVVALPIYLLYELSVAVVGRVERKLMKNQS